ncbi:MAG TPA: hypothetical protein DCZ91_25065 [Lachnospiraceae bacterium]|nr:hypothetical protein [Lachnospiraceae bacterium]
MRQKILLAFTVCVYLAAMAFGIVKKQTYTDLAGQEDYLEQLQVAEITEEFAEPACTAMSRSLPDAAIILRIEVTGEIDHLFQVDRQKAVIRQVYAGSGLEAGEEIYVYSHHWKLALYEDPISIERGFVNIMEVGTEYLVFAEAVSEDRKNGALSVKTYDDFFITPVFCYEERRNAIVPVTGDTTYVPYKDVMDNEFFAASEEALQIIESLKGQMLSLYPKDMID